MKNKSKLKKIRQQGAKKTTVPKEWLYLSPVELNVKMLGDGICEASAWSVQIWQEFGVLEIEIPEQTSMDFEQMEVNLQDEYSNAFLQSKQTRALFAVTIDPENFAQVEEIMKQIIKKWGGVFCGDTEDFTPQV